MSVALINNKYRITRRIGGGSFGEIYMGMGPSNEKVAIKFERLGSRCPQLRHEFKVYRELANCMGFCSVYFFGTQENYNVIVMDLLGPSLEDLFTRCSRRFSLKTVLQIADQILERIDCLHSRHLIHRDIKPANFTIGVNDQASNIYCVDFGLSKRYRNPKTLLHIPHRDGRSLTGTPRYASINNHLGIEQSRRDDLESIGYILVYFLKGSLPWQGLKAKNAQKKYRLILEKKQQVSIAQLCQGLPSQFAEFLAYSRSLKFDAKPDIPYLRKMFRDLYHTQGLGNIGKVWDWEDMDMDYGDSSNPPDNGVNLGLLFPGVTSNTPGANGMVGGMLRPSTAAAVGGEGDMDMIGDGMYAEGLEEGGYDPSGIAALRIREMSGSHMRPSTTGAPNSQGLNGAPKSSILPPPQGSTSAWLYGRPSGVAGQIPQEATDPALYLQRRPHTAHGSRGPGNPSGPGNAGNFLPTNISASNPTSMSNLHANMQYAQDGKEPTEDEENDDHVVAGARAMMRYRRTKTDPPNVTSTVPIIPNGVTMPKPTTAGGVIGRTSSIGTGYLTNTTNGAQIAAAYPMRGASGSSNVQNPSRQAVPYLASSPSGAGSGGWVQSGDNRPKSATLNTSGPSSKPYAGGNPSTPGGVNIPSSAAAPVTYGAIKNRFLVRDNQGSSKVVNLASGILPASTTTSATNSGPSSATGSAARSSKLFGLTR